MKNLDEMMSLEDEQVEHILGTALCSCLSGTAFKDCCGLVGCFETGGKFATVPCPCKSGKQFQHCEPCSGFNALKLERKIACMPCGCGGGQQFRYCCGNL